MLRGASLSICVIYQVCASEYGSISCPYDAVSSSCDVTFQQTGPERHGHTHSSDMRGSERPAHLGVRGTGRTEGKSGGLLHRGPNEGFPRSTHGYGGGAKRRETNFPLRSWSHVALPYHHSRGWTEESLRLGHDEGGYRFLPRSGRCNDRENALGVHCRACFHLRRSMGFQAKCLA